MTIEQAWFVLEHASAEGLQVYLKAIKTIKKNCVDVVLCKDCKWFHQAFKNDGRCLKHDNDYHEPNWFCADGERKDS